MPLATVQANSKDCSPLPQFVHDIMDYITGQADLAEGIFRKSGSKKRIDEIRDICARLLPHQRIPLHLLDNSQVHDLGDSLKRYFRELPECILTNRLSKMIENIVSELPNTNDEHFTALHYCILLLPSENREGLMILLRFLKGIARYSASNEMTASNLATCWMPSLFRFSQEDKEIADKNGIGHKNGGRKLTRRKTIGIPNDKERNAYEAIKRLLSKMIEDWEKLTGLPQSMVPEIAKNGLKICHDLGVPIKNGQFDFTEELHLNFRRQLFRLKEDYFAGWKNWSLQRVFTDGSQIFTREINDMIPLKCFRIQTSISAPPNLILMAILYGRNFWDSNVTGWKRIGPSGQNFDIIKLQYRRDLLDPKDKHSFLARRWSYSEFDHDSICSLIECSVVPRGQDKQNVVGSNVSVYESKFLIREICPGHSQLTYISRLDFKGRSSQWYDRVYGEMLVNQIKRLKQNLFKYNISSTKGTIV